MSGAWGDDMRDDDAEWREMTDRHGKLGALEREELRNEQLEAERDKLRAENEWLKRTLAIPPGYRLQPISEFDAMESARIESDALRAERDKLRADLQFMVENAAVKHRPAYDEQQLIIMALRDRVAELETAGVGYSQQTVDAITKDRHTLREAMQEAVRDFHGKSVLFSSRFLKLAGREE